MKNNHKDALFIRKQTASSRILYVLAGVLLAATLIGYYVVYSSDAYAVEGEFDTTRIYNNWGRKNNISPNPFATYLFDKNGTYNASIFDPPGTNNRSTGSGFKHVLKNSETTRIERIDVYVYFDSNELTNAERTVQIKVPGKGKGWCYFGIDDNKSRELSVVTSGPTGQRTITKNYGKANENKSDATCDNFRNDSIVIKENQIYKDPKSLKYVARVSFRLSGAKVNQNISNQVAFTMQAPGASNVGLKGQTPEDSFGLLESAQYDSAKYGIKLGVPFGVPCDDQNQILSNQKVVLFDTDRDDFGDTKFYVAKRLAGTDDDPQALDKNEYSFNQSKNNVKWESDGPGHGYFISTSLKNQNVAGRTSTVTIKKMSGEYNYILMVVNRYQVGNSIAGVGTINSSPVGNVLSLSVPTDTITGEIKCDPYVPDAEPYTAVRPPQYAYYADLEVDARVSVSKVPGENHPWRQYVSRYNSKPSFGSTTTTNSNGCSVIGGDCSTFKGTYYYDGSDESAERLNQSYSKSTPDPIGTWTCFVTRIRTNPETPPSPLPVEGEPGYPYTPPIPRYKYSAIDESNCSLSVKYPKIQVQSHDLRVGGDTNTSYEPVDNKQYGSWSEYALLLNGCSQGARTSSGAALYRGSNANPGSGLLNLNDLSFANTGDVCDGSVGEYGGVSEFDEDNYLGAEENREDPGSTFGGPSTFGTDANGKGVRKIYDHKGTLRITKNITYNNSYSSVRGIPRVIIAADDIIIDKDVERIDAWLISRGSLSTCDLGSEDANFQYSTPLDAGMCDKQIVFNGPVMANTVYLHRTFGSFDGEAQSGDTRDDRREAPSEIFNLRPDAFLSAYAGNNTPPVATTDFVIELPPRF